MRYLPVIDGLRAAAVVPVILFHADLAWCSGGFVGVDVFFVISGYLITSSILSQLDAGTFTLVDFYERRARRILPALLLVTVVSAPFAWALMLPHQFSDFCGSVLATLGFVSNVFFWQDSGYFARANELKPLLHTWSLAVEEQYYLVFPIALLAILRFARSWIVPAIAGIAVISFALSQWGALYAPTASFYLVHTRIWELLVGALVPLCFRQGVSVSRSTAEIASVSGLALIAVAVLSYHNVPYPGVYALAPVFGSVLIIVFAAPGTVVGSILASRILVALGLVSYSAYLWHQPLFAFARLSGFHDKNVGIFLALSVFAFIFAALTWKFVEQPFRNRQLVGRRFLVTSSSFAVLALGVVAIGGHLTSGYEQLYIATRLTPEEAGAYKLVASARTSTLLEDMVDDSRCNFWSRVIDEDFEERFRRCAAEHGTATVVLGDSHAMNMYNALAQARLTPFLVGVSGPGCRPKATQDCYYTAFDELLVRNAGRIGIIFYHQSGSYLIRDEQGRVDSGDAFKPRRSRSIDRSAIGQVGDYLNKLAGFAPVVWLGPFVEARANLSNFAGMAKEGFKLNPVAIKAFAELDAELERVHAKSRPRFGFLALGRVLGFSENSLLQGDCVMYRDADHLSRCGEGIVGAKLKPFLSAYVADAEAHKGPLVSSASPER